MEDPPTLQKETPAALLDRMRAGAGRLRSSTARQRVRRLKKLRAALSKARPSLFEAFRADLGKSSEAVDLSEILPVALELDHAIRNLRRWMRPRRVDAPLAFLGTRNEILCEPKGAVLIVAPWNYPVTLTLGPLVSAIAAGCSAVIKPSEYTPEVARVVHEIVASCFDGDEVSVIQGGPETSDSLIRLPFDHIYFTGSPRIGRIVMARAAENLTPVTLELGGKSPALVDSSVNLTETARRVVFGKFSNAGQTCIAPDYVLVERAIHDAFVSELTQQIGRFYPGGSESPDYTRIVSRRHHKRLAEMCAEAIEYGAAISGGESDLADRYLAPTVLSGVDPQAAVLNQEIFGPILPVVPFDDLSEAIDQINAREPALAIYVFSHRSSVVDRLLAETRSGGVAVNDALLQFVNPHLPFGGVGTSGIGRGHGHWGFLEFSNQRAVLRQSRLYATSSLFYPPMTNLKRRTVRALLRLYGVK